MNEPRLIEVGYSGDAARIGGWEDTRRFPLDAALAGAAEEEAGAEAVVGP